MELLINKKLKAVTNITVFPGNSMYALEVIISGPYKERTTLHPIIVDTLKADDRSTNDSMSLGQTGTSTINVLKCTSLQFIDSLRKNKFFHIEECEPDLKKS